MPPVTDFGTAYLDPESFRRSAELFGVGMAMCDYPDSEPGNAKLAFVLQSASRHIDAYCGRVFTPGDLAETHRLDLATWRFSVNNPPVVSISECKIRYAADGTITIDPAKIYISNQQNYCEITRYLEAAFTFTEIGTEILEPQVEITYKSLQSIPKHVQLACGFQAGHLINSGFVDKTLPPNFGKIDMGGLSINNKKGYRSSEEMRAGSLSADAERLLTQEIRFVAS